MEKSKTIHTQPNYLFFFFIFIRLFTIGIPVLDIVNRFANNVLEAVKTTRYCCLGFYSAYTAVDCRENPVGIFVYFKPPNQIPTQNFGRLSRVLWFFSRIYDNIQWIIIRPARFILNAVHVPYHCFNYSKV